MRRTEINNLYFNWIVDIIKNGAHGAAKRLSYKRLLHHLHEIEFYYLIPMDNNRLQDGIELRYRFGRENSIPPSEIATYLDVQTCSILEMMVALAVRCEEQFISRLDGKSRAGEWVWRMLESLGLRDMNDKNFDIWQVDSVIDRFLKREYRPDGAGGLFYIEGCTRDLRNVEIWYQLNWYLETYCQF